MGKVRRFAAVLWTIGLVSLVASSASAQSTGEIAGVVRDASGGVLPGVTVEASSPALIEKTRSAVTDGQGQYKITNLRAGVYSVTFTLSGFSTIKRPGLELNTNVTLPVNAEMSVGALAETLTVSGASPVARSVAEFTRCGAGGCGV
jgi:hypothetical protein